MRRYRQADKQSLIALWHECFPDPAPHNEPSLMLNNKLKIDRLLFVAEKDGKIIASCMAGYDGHRGWLYTVATSPEIRRKGLASKLVKHVIHELHELGCIKINLQIGADNEQLSNFYQSLGFAVERRTSMGMLMDTGQ